MTQSEVDFFGIEFRRTGVVISPIKTIPADEFPNDACGRDLVIHIRLADIVQDANDGANLLIAAVLWRDLRQEGEDMLLQHGKLVQS